MFFNVMSSEIRSGQVKLSQIKSGQFKSGQVRSGFKTLLNLESSSDASCVVLLFKNKIPMDPKNFFSEQIR